MSDDWMLAQGTVDFRNEERWHRHGRGVPPPFEAMLDPDPELQLATAKFHDPCGRDECDGMCECE